MAQSDYVLSLLKALDILKLVCASPDGMRLNEIADHLGLKKPTAHNLVRTLRARGFLDKDTANRYFAGNAIRELSDLRNNTILLKAAGRELRRLHHAFPEATLTLSELLPGGVECRLRMSPERPGELQQGTTRALVTFSPYVSASAVCLQSCAANAGAYERNFPFAEYGLARWENEERFLEVKRKVRSELVYRMERSPGITEAFFLFGNYSLGVRLDKEVPGVSEKIHRAVADIRTILEKELTVMEKTE